MPACRSALLPVTSSAIVPSPGASSRSAVTAPGPTNETPGKFSCSHLSMSPSAVLPV